MKEGKKEQIDPLKKRISPPIVSIEKKSFHTQWMHKQCKEGDKRN